MTHLADVYDFHNQITGDAEAGPPHLPSLETCRFRVQFLLEEVGELASALGLQVAVSVHPIEPPFEREETEVLADALDALVDLEYVTLGTIIKLGLAKVHERAWELVHNANMRKKRGAQAKRGGYGFDAVKPPGWRAPDLRPLVAGASDARSAA